MSTIPSAPQEGDTGYPIIFMSYDDTTALAAALFRAYQIQVLQGGTVGNLGVYPTSGTCQNFGKTLNGTIAERITGSSGTLPCQGVLIKASTSNASTVYIGESNVTANEGLATSGYPLEPGESVGVPCRDANDVWVRGANGDKIACLASGDA
jgi:hypothetical protein